MSKSLQVGRVGKAFQTEGITLAKTWRWGSPCCARGEVSSRVIGSVGDAGKDAQGQIPQALNARVKAWAGS